MGLPQAYLERIRSAPWFSRVGTFPNTKHAVGLTSLRVFGQSKLEVTDRDGFVAQRMSWMPSSNAHPDPFYGETLVERVEAAELTIEASANIQHLAMATGEPIHDVHFPEDFLAGNHDLRIEARGGAMRAARGVGLELTLSTSGRWSEVFEIYLSGFWPLGLLPDGKLVVY